MRVTIVERRAGWAERWAKAMEILIAAGREDDAAKKTAEGD